MACILDTLAGLGNAGDARPRSSLAPWATRIALLAIALAFVPGAAAQSGEQGEPSGERTAQESATSPPELTNLRYTEDYSYLRDAAKRTGAWWEPFKFIPLDSSGTSYLTLGAELRFREEGYWNFNWGEVPADNYQ
jgi:hypothetical protein